MSLTWNNTINPKNFPGYAVDTTTISGLSLTIIGMPLIRSVIISEI
jgi:hypothetical protein